MLHKTYRTIGVRTVILAFVAAALLLPGPSFGCDAAQYFSGKTLKIVVGYAPGGGYDTYADY